MKMITRKAVATLEALISGIILSLTLTTGAMAQEKKPATKSKQDRLSGAVQMIDKNNYHSYGNGIR
jgi:hypothetical protein